MKIRILSVLLVLLIVLSVPACKNSNPAEDNNTSDQSNETHADATSDNDNTEAQQPKTLIAANGKTEYILLNSQNITEDFLNILINFHAAVQTTASVSFLRDNVSSSQDADNIGEYEILFGAVNREESKEVYASIGYDGYAVRMINKKIVIAAYTKENMTKAVEAFLREATVAEKNGDNVSLYYVKDVVYTGEAGLFFGVDNPLSSYKIVSSSNATSFAAKIAVAIEAYSGIVLQVVDDKAPVTDHEIIIGTTNRPESNSINADNPVTLNIKAVGKKLVICTANDNYSNLWNLFVEIFLYNAPNLNFPKNADEKIIKYKGTDQKTLTGDADIRIMSFNILSEEWDAAAGINPRINGVIGCILYYKPDVVGIQEVSTQWHKYLKEYLTDEYVLINADILGKTDYNYTMLAYRKETVKLIEDDLYFYSVGNSQRLRLINAGYFEHIKSGKRFVATSTHYNANHGGDNTTQRLIQATEFVDKVIEYTEKYNCPIVSTGDYNCNEETSPYKRMMSSGILYSSKYEALQKGQVLKTTHGLGSIPPAGEISIDHILYTEGVTPLYYSTLIDPFLSVASDHTPLIADFKFN